MTKKKIKEITIANNSMRLEYLQAIIDQNKRKGIEAGYKIKYNNFSYCSRAGFNRLVNGISFSEVTNNNFFSGEVKEIKPKTFWQKIKYLIN